MTDEHRIAIASNSSLGADEVARRTFQTVRKGLDPDAVRSFLESVAGELRAGARREDELQRRLEEAERRAAAPPELDEGTLAAALGVETARVLQAAHEAARQVVERAEARAEEMTAQAQRMLEEKAAEGEDGARRIREEARVASAAVLETARADAERLVESTKAECRTMVAEARQVRSRVLRDLTERRRVLRVQVEQLLAGRGSLLSAVDSVRHAVDDLTTRLTRAEEEARSAADAAAPDADELETGEAATEEALEREAAELRLAYLDDLAGAGVAAGEPAAAVSQEPAPAGEAPAEGLVLDEGGDAADADLVALRAPDAEPGVEEPGDVDFEGVTVLGRVPKPAPAPAPAAEDLPPAPPAVPYEEEAEKREPAGATAASEVASKVAVDELFAKIRASRAEQVARAREILEGEAHAVAASPGGAGDLLGVEPDEGDTSEAPAVAPEAEQAAPAADDEESAAPAGAGPDERTAAAFATRDQLLGPVVARLGRALKRALQDDQNDLLDRLRKAAPGASLDDLLPHSQQEERYAAAARSAIEAARKAGTGFAAEALGEPAPHAAGGDGDEARAGAQRLSEELVGSLRLRIEGGLAAAAGDREGAGADVVGVAYREWKGSRVTEIAGDHATRAFAAAEVATLAGAGKDAPPVTWAVDDGGTHCPDCDDNALAGAQPAGEPFPTGQTHPPVHPGCRCLLVPAPS